MPTTELAIISRIGDVIASSANYHDSLRRIMEIIAQATGGEVCSILILNEPSGELVLEGTFGFDQEAVHDVRMPVEHGIVGHCLRTLETVNVARKQDHPEFEQFGTPKAAEFHGLLSVPLVSGGAPIGVLVVEKREAKEFTPTSRALAQAIASPLATFARNARLSETLSDHSREAERRRTEEGEGARAERVLRGNAITDGVVQGTAYIVFGAELLESISLETTEDTEAEKKLFHDALKVAREDTVALQEEASEILEEADAAIFYAHLLLLEDPTFTQRVEQGLDRGFTLRFALKYAYSQFDQELSQLDNTMVRERLADLKDVVLRVYQAADEVQGTTPRPVVDSGEVGDGREHPVAVARELLPSQLIRLPLAELAGIVCEHGGTTSHVAILAKTLRIPMIVGVEGVTRVAQARDEVILDCTTGICYLNPSQEVKERFREVIAFHEQKPAAPTTCPLAVTTDGVPIRVEGNISLLNELPLLNQYGAQGVGLYRTEFMFMIRNSFPSEDEQYALFRKVVAQGGERGAVTIRLLDVGGDKPLPYVDFGEEENPVLGWRGIRFLMSNRQFLEPHVRAILRASAHGQVNLLLPMIADLDELLHVREVIRECEKQVRDSGHELGEYAIGVMIEVPAVLWGLPEILEQVDFVSIGSNDLIQYSFAVDRGNQKVSHWFRQFHPLVLKMVKATCEAGNQAGKPVALCGEMGGIPLGVPFLIGAGLRELSVNPWKIPGVVDVVTKVSVQECEDLLSRGIACSRDEEIIKLMDAFALDHGLVDSRRGSALPR